MTDPARLIDTRLDGLSRRTLEAAIADEPPTGAQTELWRALAVALPTAGVLVGATTTAGAVATGGKVAAGVTAATTTGASAIAGSAVTGGAITGSKISAIGAVTGGAVTGGAVANGITTATAGVVSATSSGLGVIAAKAVAVGLGIGVAVNIATAVIPQSGEPSTSTATSAIVVPAVPAQPAAIAQRAPVLAHEQSQDDTQEAPAALPIAPKVVGVKLFGVRAPEVNQPANTDSAPKIGAGANVATLNKPIADDPSVDELRVESRLLAQVRQALGAGQTATALDIINKHRQQFAAGKLAQERDALEVQALVKAGRQPEAKARAQAFLVHFPQSPHAERMRAIAE